MVSTAPAVEAPKVLEPQKPTAVQVVHEGSKRSTASRQVLRALLPVAKVIAAGNSPNLDWPALAAALESGHKGRAKDLLTAAV